MPWNGTRSTEAVVKALHTIKASGRSLFGVAIMSGKPEAANCVYRNVIGAYVQDYSEVIKNMTLAMKSTAYFAFTSGTDQM